MIYLCKSAQAKALNHGNTEIQSNDILQAERDYSQFVVNALLTEADVQLDKFEELLYEFAGAEAVITSSTIANYIQKVNIPIDKKVEIISLLCELTFLGLETAPGEFQFIYDISRKKVLESLARKMAEQVGEQRFLINVPFHSFLEIRPTQGYSIR